MATQTRFDMRAVDSGLIWRERIFWMAAGILFLWYPTLIINSVGQIAFCFAPGWQKFYRYGFCNGWPVLLAGWLAAKGYFNSFNLLWLFQSRLRLIILWLLLSVPECGSLLINYDSGSFYFAGWQALWSGFFTQWLNDLEYSALPLFLLIWLLPARNRQAVRPAASPRDSKFDLSAALAGWRMELAAQPQLAADDRRELERHLADAMLELRRRGLNEEESFRQASRSIGSPQQLAEEFAKADPTKAWRERIFWAAIGIIVFWQVKLIMAYTIDLFRDLSSFFIPDFARFYAVHYNIIPDLVLLLTAVLIIRRQPARPSIMVWLFQNRFRLTMLLIFLAILCSWGQQLLVRMENLQMHRHGIYLDTWKSFLLRTSLVYLEFGAGPLILAVWFLPKQYHKTSPADLRLKQS
jgi:hypothetical protein